MEFHIPSPKKIESRYFLTGNLDMPPGKSKNFKTKY